MRLIHPDHAEYLHSMATTRALEQQVARQKPAHHLMALAGAAVARLARALVPHARCIWVACGPGNNGGDGLVAASHLHQWAQSQGGWPRVFVTLSPQALACAPLDARHAWQQAQAAGVEWADSPPPTFDLAIDAVFGIGCTRVPQDPEAQWISLLRSTASPVLCVDVPSGLQADTGRDVLPEPQGTPVSGAGPRFTLSLLTLKPGLFTASGRDAAGQVWFDDLQTSPETAAAPVARLLGRSAWAAAGGFQKHVHHKGSYGDVMVLGGQDQAFHGVGMTGAALLAARAALHAGAGRVLVGLLGEPAQAGVRWDPVCPELMFRSPSNLLDELGPQAAVVCGCGGGQAVLPYLPQLLNAAERLVLDADALNAIAASTELQSLLLQRQQRSAFTVLTPHPLEAARLLACSTADVMTDRLHAAQTLSDRWGVVCVLKGSGTVISAPQRLPCINPTGNAALATAGSGDVLAGMLGSALAPAVLSTEQRYQRVLQAVFLHGAVADAWCLPDAAARTGSSGPVRHPPGFSASRLVSGLPSLRQDVC